MNFYKIKRIILSADEYISNILWNIKNILRWLPALWNNYDFDYIFFLKIIRHKLDLMQKSMLKNDFVEDVTQVVGQIKYAIIIIDRILENDYCKEQQEEHYKKWGKEIIERKESSYPGCYEIKIYTKKSKKLGLEGQEREEQHKIYRNQLEAKKEDIHNLFNHISKYLEYWWD